LQRILVILAMMMNQNETVVRLADGILKHPGGYAPLDERETRTVTTARAVYGKAVELERRELLEGNVTPQEKDSLAARIRQLMDETLGNFSEYKK
jgi:hypothetical protein